MTKYDPSPEGVTSPPEVIPSAVDFLASLTSLSDDDYRSPSGRRWTDTEHPTRGATPATPLCQHWDGWHQPGEWKYSCCACSGMPNGCIHCREDIF